MLLTQLLLQNNWECLQNKHSSAIYEIEHGKKKKVEIEKEINM